MTQALEREDGARNGGTGEETSVGSFYIGGEMVLMVESKNANIFVAKPSHVVIDLDDAF